MNQKRLLITTIIAAAISMPAMIFLFMNRDAFAGGMTLVGGKNPDGIKAEGTQLVAAEELPDDEDVSKNMDVSLCIPVERVMSRDEITVSGNMTDALEIRIPTEEEGFYYNNQLSGSQKGISGILYDYADKTAVFTLATDGYYIPEDMLTPKNLYIALKSPMEVYGRVILIDPLRGGDDTGIRSYGFEEKNINLALAQAIADAADADGFGGVFLTRDGDTSMKQEERVAYAEKIGAELFISLGAMADPDTRITNGVSAEVKAGEDRALAESLVEALCEATGQKNLGVEIAEGGGDAAPHTIKLNIGYMTNKAETGRIGSEEYAGSAARAILDVIEREYAYSEEEE